LTAALTGWLSDDRNRRLVDRLRERGIDPVEPEPDGAGGSRPLAGTAFVVTGTLSRSRRVVKERLEALGARVTGAVSGSSTHLLAGADAGSKLDQARARGVAIVSEEELAEMVAEKGGPPLWPT
jgi:DNA ligase (NAD+)